MITDVSTDPVTTPIASINTLDSNYKYIMFKNEELIWDFNPFDTLADWTSYAGSIGATYSLISSFDGGWIGVLSGGTTIGYIDFAPFPQGYNQVRIAFGNIFGSGNVSVKINGTTKHTISDLSSYTWSGAVSTGDIIRIEEDFSIIDANIKITLMKDQSSYSVNFPENTTGDILVVGGGGAGGTQYIGGGGGAGGLVYDTNISLSGTYNILVGRGGVAVSTGGEEDGLSSKISQSASTLYEGYGGGNGGTYSYPNGETGGSSGGTTWTSGRTQNNNDALTNHPLANATKGTPIDKSFGNQGAVYYVVQGKFYSEGGGGAGSNAYRETGKYGWGGDGKLINITGQNLYYAGGGGGGSDWAGYAASGGSGIGGNGASGNEDPNISPTSGAHHTGSGGCGGGGGSGGAVNDGGGSGGSGIVIIRYRDK